MCARANPRDVRAVRACERVRRAAAARSCVRLINLTLKRYKAAAHATARIVLHTCCNPRVSGTATFDIRINLFVVANSPR